MLAELTNPARAQPWGISARFVNAFVVKALSLSKYSPLRIQPDELRSLRSLLSFQIGTVKTLRSDSRQKKEKIISRSTDIKEEFACAM